MLKKIILLVILTCLLGVGNAYAYTCEQDNQVGCAESDYCCCKLNAGSTTEYTCNPKSSKCTSTEIPVGKRDKDDKKVCPCHLKVEG